MGRDIKPEEIIKKLKKPTEKGKLAERLEINPEELEEVIELLRSQGYQIEEAGNERIAVDREATPSESRYVFPENIEGKYRFGIVSDTHLGSNQQQLTFLNWVYDRFEQEGIKHVFHAGDLVTGVGVYRGQHSEIFLHTYDQQVDYAIEKYPRRKGIQTKVIGGNHDLVFVKKIGADPLRAISQKRSDIEYLGQFSAWVELTPNLTMYLVHPDGGQAYAISYKLQKFVESFEGGKKPNILVAGHWHQMGYFMARNVHAIYPGCFEAQTDYERRKALQPQVGAVIIDLEVDDEGRIHTFIPEFIRFFVPKQHDW